MGSNVRNQLQFAKIFRKDFLCIRIDRSDTLRLFSRLFGLKTCPGLICNDRVKSQGEIPKIITGSSRFRFVQDS